MELIELLRLRRSKRRFSGKKVEPEKVDLLLKAGLLSPSSKSSTPWEFIAVDEPDLLTQLSVSKEHGAKLIAGAPLAIVVLGDTTESDVWVEDCSIASTIIQLEAEDLGLGSCWVQMRERKNVHGEYAESVIRKLLGIPEHLGVLSVVAIGYPEEVKPPHELDKLKYEKIHRNKF